jgi:dCMP deaminase
MLDTNGIKSTRDEVHRRFLKQAYDWAWENSDDPRTKTATLLVRDGEVVAYGVNKIPAGVKKLPERLERPLKYKYVTHAERTAYYNAAKAGIKTEGTTAYTPWLACTDCAIAIIEGGSKTVVSHRAFNDKTTDRWAEDIVLALGMLREAGVEVLLYDGEIGEGTRAIFDGKEWTP